MPTEERIREHMPATSVDVRGISTREFQHAPIKSQFFRGIFLENFVTEYKI